MKVFMLLFLCMSGISGDGAPDAKPVSITVEAETISADSSSTLTLEENQNLNESEIEWVQIHAQFRQLSDQAPSVSCLLHINKLSDKIDETMNFYLTINLVLLFVLGSIGSLLFIRNMRREIGTEDAIALAMAVELSADRWRRFMVLQKLELCIQCSGIVILYYFFLQGLNLF